MPFLILNIIPKSGIFIKKIEYRGPFFSYAINTSINLSHYPWALKLKKRELRREVVGKGSSQKKHGSWSHHRENSLPRCVTDSQNKYLEEILVLKK